MRQFSTSPATGRPVRVAAMELPLAVSVYQLSVWIHICAVVIGFGMTFVEAILFPVALNLSPRHLPLVHRLQIVINRNFATPALVIILITGIYQVADAGWGFGSFWISASFLIVIVLGGMLGGYFIPSDRKLGAMIDGEIAAAGDAAVEPSDAYLAKARLQGLMGAVASILVIIAIYLMVVKPGA